MTVGEALFGLPIDRVHDVFRPTSVTPVPLAQPEVVGLLNLRGRVVTALCLRRRLGLAAPGGDTTGMAVGLEQGGETFGLVVDAVGEVLRPPPGTFEPTPPNLDPRWRGLALGVHRLDGGCSSSSTSRPCSPSRPRPRPPDASRPTQDHTGPSATATGRHLERTEHRERPRHVAPGSRFPQGPQGP